jgi:AcrR family transcriptional regulator
MATRTFGRYYPAGMPKSSVQRLVREVANVSGVPGATRVTKGALYHHFSGKQALFEAVFERVETDASKSINKALRGQRDPWEKAQAGLAAFLEIVRQPRYRRIVIQEGPSVLGYERFREQEERSTFGSVLDIVRSVLGAGDWELDEGMLQTFARIFFGAMSSAGESVATAEDPELAAWRVEAAIGFMITGFQTLADAGIDLPTAPPPEEPDELE